MRTFARYNGSLSLVAISVILGLSACLSVYGQLQHGGQPFDIAEGIKAEDVMYVLSPPDPFEIESLLEENFESGLKVLNYAIERAVDISPESHGSWIEYKGYRVWRVHIISPGAISLGTIFQPYRLKGGARVFIYAPDRKSMKGSFNAQNNKVSGVFAVGHIPGDEIVIELQVPGGQEEYGELKIASISHAFLQTCPGDFGCSQACEIDVNCEEGDEWQTIKRSVVRIKTTTQYCTGVMVNNTAYDGKPYLLTAEHCINSFSLASTAIFYFNYESAACFGEDGSLDLSISHSTLKAHGDSIDFSLVELSTSPPDSFNAYYAGWDLSENPAPGVVTIHHPMGDVKKISIDFDDVSIPQSEEEIIGGGELLDYHYFSMWWVHQWDIGSTEGGSSGGPLFNSDRRVIGTLSGGQALCGKKIDVDPVTGRDIFSKTVNVNDYFTRTGVAWNYYGDQGPNLKEWLDPLNTGQTTIGGYNPVTNGQKFVTMKDHLNLYPNPAKERIIISLNLAQSGAVRYTVYDLRGKLILTEESDISAPFELGLPALSPGIYILKAEGNHLNESLKFIIE